jgi:hypothetical protein
MNIRMWPPYKCQVDPADISGTSAVVPSEIPRRLVARDPQPVSPSVTIDGEPSVATVALQIDFIRDEFDRRLATDDPPIDFAFSLANSLIGRVRVLTRSPFLKPIDKYANPWRVMFSNDDGSELAADPERHRARFATSKTLQVTAVAQDLWQSLEQLPSTYQPPAWDKLLLDAFGLLPETGPALVLGFTALETRMSAALDELAVLVGLNRDLWRWINNRSQHWMEPSTTDQFDGLLKALTGRSLKDEGRLWEGFQNLRSARNSFVHGGVAAIGKGDEVTLAKATKLLQLATATVEWLEELLPIASRRPRAPREAKVNLTQAIIAPMSSDAAPTPPAQTEESGQ